MRGSSKNYITDNYRKLLRPYTLPRFSELCPSLLGVPDLPVGVPCELMSMRCGVPKAFRPMPLEPSWRPGVPARPCCELERPGHRPLLAVLTRPSRSPTCSFSVSTFFSIQERLPRCALRMAVMAEIGSTPSCCCVSEDEEPDNELTSFMSDVRDLDRSSSWLFRDSASWYAFSRSVFAFVELLDPGPVSAKTEDP